MFRVLKFLRIANNIMHIMNCKARQDKKRKQKYQQAQGQLIRGEGHLPGSGSLDDEVGGADIGFEDEIENSDGAAISSAELQEILNTSHNTKRGRPTHLVSGSGEQAFVSKRKRVEKNNEVSAEESLVRSPWSNSLSYPQHR